MSVAHTKNRNRHGRVGVKQGPRRATGSPKSPRSPRWQQNAISAEKKRKLALQGVIVDETDGRSWRLPRVLRKAAPEVEPAADLSLEEVALHTDPLPGNEILHVWLDTKQAAASIDMSTGYIKDHAKELGGEKHGLRWRFDQATLLARWKEINA